MKSALAAKSPFEANEISKALNQIFPYQTYWSGRLKAYLYNHIDHVSDLKNVDLFSTYYIHENLSALTNGFYNDLEHGLSSSVWSGLKSGFKDLVQNGGIVIKRYRPVETNGNGGNGGNGNGSGNGYTEYYTAKIRPSNLQSKEFSVKLLFQNGKVIWPDSIPVQSEDYIGTLFKIGWTSGGVPSYRYEGTMPEEVIPANGEEKTNWLLYGGIALGLFLLLKD
jgi:hypothetical protein